MSYLYADSESWERVNGNRYAAYGTGTIEERLAGPDDIEQYVGRSSAWIEAVPHILANSRESIIRR